MKIKEMRTCPKCNSLKVTPNFSNPGLIAFGLMVNWKCERCGFVGNESFFQPVPVKSLKPLKKLEGFKNKR